jgi:hypothetical protein
LRGDTIHFLFVCGTRCPISLDLEGAGNPDFLQCYLFVVSHCRQRPVTSNVAKPVKPNRLGLRVMTQDRVKERSSPVPSRCPHPSRCANADSVLRFAQLSPQAWLQNCLLPMAGSRFIALIPNDRAGLCLASHWVHGQTHIGTNRTPQHRRTQSLQRVDGGKSTTISRAAISEAGAY